ncbi:MAG TPA: acyl-CoA dehydrogenase family protein [Burkholderiales bacterium]|nr:acyl-CoA dehydrogenase family protein [Burkholderiales bacterium]
MNAPDETRLMLVESATRLFADHVDQKMLDAAKRDGWSQKLWQVLEQAELPRVSIPEELGGAGGTLSDAAAVLRVAGRYCAPVPLAETGMLAGWMLAGSGLAVPRGPLAAGPAHDETLAARRDGGRWIISGRLARVPWARVAGRLVLLARDGDRDIVASVDPAHCEITPGRNLANEPRDDVVLRDVALAAADAAPAGAGITRELLRYRGALARAVAMAGALERALALSVEYAQQRVQFGRKIGQFQAIQQELARFAGEVAAAVAAALSAAGVLERHAAGETGHEDAMLAVATAKIRAAQAAHEGALIAHQVHGAIGVTDEYALHHSTLRLWAWREEFGNEAGWAAALGRALHARGADRLWTALTTNGEEA